MEEEASFSDNFVMYEVKVVECTKNYPHDFTACPWLHPGERARRRDPRVYNYSSTLCPDVKKDKVCARGLNCPYSHNIFEYYMHFDRYRTRMCDFGEKCTRKLCFFAHTPSQLRVTAKSAAAQQAASNNSGKKGGKGNKGATSSSNGSSSNLQQVINPASASPDAQALAGAAATSQEPVAATAPAVSRLLQLLADKASTTSAPSARLLGQPSDSDDSLDEQTAAAIMLLLEQLEGEQCNGCLGSSSMSPSGAAPLQPKDPADSAAGGSSPRTPVTQPTTTADWQLPAQSGFSAAGKGRPCSWELSPGSSNASNAEQGPWASSSLWGQGSQDAAQLLPTLSLSSAASTNSVSASGVLPAAAATGSKSCQPLQMPCLVSPGAVPHSSSSSSMKLQGGLLQGPIPVELLYPGLQSMAGSAPAFRGAQELFSAPGAQIGSSGFTAAAAGLVQGQQGVIDTRQLSGGVLSAGMALSQACQLQQGSSCLEFPSGSTLDNLTASLSTSNLNSSHTRGSSSLPGSTLVSLASPVGVSSSSSVLGSQVTPALLNQLATQQQVQVQQGANAAVLGGLSNTLASMPGSEALAMYGSPTLPGYGNQAYSAAAVAAAAQQQELQLNQQQAALLLQQQQHMQCQTAARSAGVTLAGPSPLIGMAGGELGLPANLLHSADVAVIAQQLQQCQTQSGVSEIGLGGQGMWGQQDRGVMGMLLQGNAGPWSGAHTQVSPCLVGLSV